MWAHCKLRGLTFLAGSDRVCHERTLVATERSLAAADNSMG